MNITMGTFVVIIDPAHEHYGDTGKVVGLSHMPPRGVLYSIDIGYKFTPATLDQLSTSIQDALDSGALDKTPIHDDIAGYTPGLPETVPLVVTFDEFKRFMESSGRKIDRDLPNGHDYEHIGLPPVTNESDGVE